MYGVVRWVVLVVFAGAAVAALYARAVMPAAVLAVIAFAAAALGAAMPSPSDSSAVEASGSAAEWMMLGGLALVAGLAVVTVRADRAASRIEKAALEVLKPQPAQVVRMAPLPSPAPAPVVEQPPARPVVDTIRPDLLPAMYRPVEPQVAPVLVPVEVQSAPVEEAAPAPTWTVEAIHIV